MGSKEGADHRRSGHSPDREAEEHRRVLRNAGHRGLERRFKALFRFELGLLHRLEVVGRIGLLRLDLEQVGVQGEADPAGDDPRISAA